MSVARHILVSHSFSPKPQLLFNCSGQVVWDVKNSGLSAHNKIIHIIIAVDLHKFTVSFLMMNKPSPAAGYKSRADMGITDEWDMGRSFRGYSAIMDSK